MTVLYHALAIYYLAGLALFAIGFGEESGDKYRKTGVPIPFLIVFLLVFTWVWLPVVLYLQYSSKKAA